ncbi:LPXTG cell wall anchor domain-containing protein [Terriglobus sp. ADX1]
MDMTTVIRVVAGVLAVLILGVIVYRRRRQA